MEGRWLSQPTHIMKDAAARAPNTSYCNDSREVHHSRQHDSNLGSLRQQAVITLDPAKANE